jgi:hypothetical protein
VPIVIESPGRRQASLQSFLAAMAERRVTEIMPQAKRFRQILVKPERPRHRSADLGYFQRVGKPDAEMVAIRRNEHLRFVPEAAKGDRVNDTVPVALEGIAWAAGAGVVFREGPAARF